MFISSLLVGIKTSVPIFPFFSEFWVERACDYNAEGGLGIQGHFVLLGWHYLRKQTAWTFETRCILFKMLDVFLAKITYDQ